MQIEELPSNSKLSATTDEIQQMFDAAGYLERTNMLSITGMVSTTNGRSEPLKGVGHSNTPPSMVSHNAVHERPLEQHSTFLALDAMETEANKNTSRRPSNLTMMSPDVGMML